MCDEAVFKGSLTYWTGLYPLIVVSIIISLRTNFSYVVEDRVLVSYIIVMILMCCALLYPLYQTRDKKGYFIIAGIATICLASVPTVISRVSLATTDY